MLKNGITSIIVLTTKIDRIYCIIMLRYEVLLSKTNNKVYSEYEYFSIQGKVANCG